MHNTIQICMFLFLPLATIMNLKNIYLTSYLFKTIANMGSSSKSSATMTSGFLRVAEASRACIIDLTLVIFISQSKMRLSSNTVLFPFVKILVTLKCSRGCKLICATPKEILNDIYLCNATN